MTTEEEEGGFSCLATQKEQDNFVKLCGQGDLESVTQLLAKGPSLTKAKKSDNPCKLKKIYTIFINSY